MAIWDFGVGRRGACWQFEVLRVTIGVVASGDLRVAERSLWEAFSRGAWVDLRTGRPEDDIGNGESWPAGRVIRAEVITRLLLGAGAAAPGYSPAVRLRGARIAGRLDLMGATVKCALVCEHCFFDEMLRFVEATTKTVRIVDSRLPAFNGARMRADGIVNLHQSIVGGVLRLEGAKISGELCLDHATIGAGNGEVAVAAEGLSVEGDVNCRGLVARGLASLRGAQISGSVDASGACMEGPGIAFNLDRAAVGELDCTGLVVRAGQISLINAQIASQLRLTGADLNGGPGGPALIADGCVAGGAVSLVKSRVQGEISLRTGQIGGRLNLNDASIDNPGGVALRLSRTEVTADAFCNRMKVTGCVKVTGASVGRRMRLDHVTLANPGGIALDAEALQAGELSLQPAEPIDGIVTLSHARLGVLRDDPTCWPEKLILDGLTYDALEPQLPARQRLQWVAAGTGGHQLQPYEQLAALYSRNGQLAAARRVLYAKEHDQRSVKTPLGRVWSILQDITIGYGYQPWRAALWLAVLLATGSIVYAAHPPPPLNAGQAPHFNPVVYTFDLLLPIVDLGEKHAYNPAGFEQWLSYLLVAAGWVLASTIVAAAARVVSRR